MYVVTLKVNSFFRVWIDQDSENFNVPSISVATFILLSSTSGHFSESVYKNIW